jgi:anti-sigma factor RsiW
MIDARTAFQAELRAAVRDARASAPSSPVSGPAPAPTRAMRRIVRAPAPLRAERRTVVRLWLPLTPLWVVLAPFAILFSPALLLAPTLRGVNPFRAAFAIGHMLLALSGTHVDVHAPDARVHVTLY